MNPTTLQFRRSYRVPLYVWLLGFAIFRFTFLIFTHNSVPLSAFLSLVFVLIPYLVIRQTRRVLAKKESPLPYQRKGKHTAEEGKLSKALVLLATCWLYYYGLKVRQVEFDSEKVDVQGKYFLAVNFWDNEAILPGFFSSLYRLSDQLGPQNIFISITENDSRDATRVLLHSYERELKRRKIPYRLRTDNGLRLKNRHDNLDMPWLSVADRMDYMAGIRNLALEPLYGSTIQWKRIIFFNDAIWDWRGVMALLQTEGEVVCTLDLDGGGLYDSWVLKDRCGGSVSLNWPYFWHPDDQRHIKQRKPFEVGNCWNGIASLTAGPFLNTSTSTYNLAEPLRFPNSPEGCYQSECSSLPLRLFEITKSKGPRAVVVPDATVTYTQKWWIWYNVILRMRVVEWWVDIIERPWGWIWWPILGKATRWKGLEGIKGEVECRIEKWERCDRI